MDDESKEVGFNPERKQQPLRILLAEDDEGMARIIAKYTSQGHNNITVVDTREHALRELERATAEQMPFDWVITDLGLKDGQHAGYDIANAIKLNQLGHPYVTLLTGSAATIRGNKTPDDLTRELQEKGIHQLVGKPLNRQELTDSASAVRDFMKQSQNPQAQRI